jgi:hypothetical protein
VARIQSCLKSKCLYLHGIDPSAVTVWDSNYGQLFVQYSSTDEITVNSGTYIIGDFPSFRRR